MSHEIDFFNQLENSIANDTFVRLTLSKNRSKSADLQKILIKLAMIKKEPQLSFVFRENRRDVTKNYSIEAAITEIENLLGDTFLIANLFTIEKDITLSINKKGKVNMRAAKPTFTELPTRQHDKDKQRHIEKASYLVELGILNKGGQIQKDKGDKFKQINKFVEIIDGLLRKNPAILEREELKIVDMGSGKGYLTFALYDYLVNTKNIKANIIGVEIRPDLIEKCNRIANKVGYENLSFEEGFISDYTLPKTDILIALHACDTATDDAIYKGMQAGAELIICAPCCHKQIRKQMSVSETFQPLLNYGILKERQAELLTDGMRALLLESEGYKTKVFEFISTEHTGKNVMIVAEKRNNKVNTAPYLAQVAELKKEFGIGEHYLEQLLAS